MSPLLDTTVLSELAKPHGCDVKVDRWAAGQDETTFYISSLTLGEFERGIAKMPPVSPHRSRVQRALAVLERQFSGRILSVADDVVRAWGRESGAIRRRTGRWPRTVDTFLAMTAVKHDLYFATRNVADVRETPASVFNPWTDDADGLM